MDLEDLANSKSICLTYFCRYLFEKTKNLLKFLEKKNSLIELFFEKKNMSCFSA